MIIKAFLRGLGISDRKPGIYDEEEKVTIICNCGNTFIFLKEVQDEKDSNSFIIGGGFDGRRNRLWPGQKSRA